ncbi:MAG: ABC transporter permease [Oscillospiraceae bacterium]|jgi:peptide/nickel transport system permease protein|nr:ABC transporter permease [Oscillospiraceae bacterium]
MKYFAKKLTITVATVLIVTLLIFLAFNIVPGDPVRMILGTEASQERVDMLREQLGLNASMPSQYINWVGGMLTGNFGTSIKYQKPVLELIGQRVGVTFTLAVMTLILTFAVAIPLGIYSARKRGKFGDKAISTVAMVAISIPGFYLGIFFIWFFGLKLKLFMPGGYVSYRTDISAFLKFLIFPSIVMAIPNIAVVLKYLRTSIIEELKREYVKTAYIKGNTAKGVLYKHVLKNAFVPIISLIGMITANALGGSIIVEQVFGIPGIGGLLIGSITSRDFPMVQGMVVFISLIIIIVNTLADVAVQLVDPRIKIT